MKRIVQLIVLTFCVATFLTGCGQQVTKPLMDVISPTQMEVMDVISPTQMEVMDVISPTQMEVMDVISPTQMEVMDVISPTQSHIEKARMVMEKVNQRRTEAYQKAEKSGDFSTVFIDSEVIFKEELGLRRGLWVDLVEIYLNENSEDLSVLDGYKKLQVAFAKKLENDTLEMFYFDYIRTFDPLIVEYLRLSYVYPDIQEVGLLVRFRESIRESKVTIVFPENF